jgi:hypothetical protein
VGNGLAGHPDAGQKKGQKKVPGTFLDADNGHGLAI